MNKRKTIIIGIDGAAWEYIEPLINNNKLPNLRHLILQGCKGNLISTFPPLSPPAWSSFMTGVTPNKHGVFDFLSRDKESYIMRPVNSAGRRESGFWEYLNAKGLRTGICNLPTSFPAEEVDGFFISGFDSPSDSEYITYPRSIYYELKKRFGRYPLYAPECSILNRRNREEEIEAYVNSYFQHVNIQTEIMLEFMKRYQIDVLVTNYMINDTFNHYLPDVRYNYLALEHIDLNIGKYLERYADANYIIISDHGSRKIEKAFIAYKWLEDKGYLIYDKRKLQDAKFNVGLAELLQNQIKIKGYTEKIIRKFARSSFKLIPQMIQNLLINLIVGNRSILYWPYECIDVKKSIVYYCQGGIKGLRLNVKGREPCGIVDPGSDYHKIREEIIEKLSLIRDGDSGNTVFKKIYRKEELSDNLIPEVVELLPDIILWCFDNSKYTMTSNNILRKSTLNNNFIVDSSIAGCFGDHTTEGIFICSGPAFKYNLSVEALDLIDIPAIILYLHAVPVPENFDGKVKEELFSLEFKGSPVQYQAKIILEEGGAKKLYSDKEKKEVEEKLKGLGYL